MLTPVPFYFMRHGETEWNRQKRTQGQIDTPLSETGIAQARAASERLCGQGIATICSSPLQRALETARIQAEVLGLPVEVVDDLRECCLGEREGTPRDGWLDAWRRGDYLPTGAESIEAFIERSLRAVNRALERPGPVLIVAHGGIYWSIQRYAGLVAAHAIANAIPVRHDPPDLAGKCWECSSLAQAFPRRHQLPLAQSR